MLPGKCQATAVTGHVARVLLLAPKQVWNGLSLLDNTELRLTAMVDFAVHDYMQSVPNVIHNSASSSYKANL